MKKKEAMNFIRKQKGYIPYISLFELYGDDDEIPQELINIECKKTNNNHPFITNTSTNNGIRGYVSEDENHLNDGNTISFSTTTGKIFFQPEKYFTDKKVKILSVKYNQLTVKKGLFLVCCLRKTFQDFRWGDSASFEHLKKSQLYLPIKTDENDNPIIDDTHSYHEEGYIPDFDFMEEYIKSIQKVVIVDAIKYKDEIIKQMKNII